MSTSLEHLAAVAAAGVPGLAPVAVGPSPDDDADFRSAVVVDAAGRRWRVRSPLSPEASVRLETEHLVLRSFTPAVRSRLPFLVPTAAGSVAHGDLHAFVHSHIEGAPLDIDALARMAAEPDPEHHRHVPSADPPPTLTVQLGRLLAAIHALPPALVLDADLPGYTAEQCRLRRVAELRRAAATQRVPAALLHRWEGVLEDRDVWRFEPRVVHGDLQEDDLVISRGRVRGVTGWTDLHVGDPAEDFAWLLAARDARLAEGVLGAYAAACRRTSFQAPDREPDPHLLDRARLDAELALAQWLVRAVDRGADDLVADAEQMLATLEQDVARLPDPAQGAGAPEHPAEPSVPNGDQRPRPAGGTERSRPASGPESPRPAGGPQGSRPANDPDSPRPASGPDSPRPVDGTEGSHRAGAPEGPAPAGAPGPLPGRTRREGTEGPAQGRSTTS
ncbi:phosphotransferase [Kocuria sp. CPCC 205292]|uniref:phosphotransferase n=1 Tax=Kocuria cellulosilytica TaxID=3071451 RepID=UPI0034D474BD